jgi:hypothetical protein
MTDHAASEKLRKWQPEGGTKAEITKLDPADVITVEEAREKLGPLIKPLPSFDEEVLRTKEVRTERDRPGV